VLRARIQCELAIEGPEALHRRLEARDPETARRLAPRDRQRIARALEVVESSGRPLSWWHAHAAPRPGDETWTVIELVEEPATLRGRIAERTRWMFDHGLVDETAALVAVGRGESLRDLRAIGYDEALALIEGRATRAVAEDRVNLRTAQLAKRQRTWFRHQVHAVRLEAALEPGTLRERALETFGRGPAR
jgi:tRNA dimethylallyltransferase